MELPDLIARIVEARPDLAEKMPRPTTIEWGGDKMTAWTRGAFVFAASDASLIVQGIVAEELAVHGEHVYYSDEGDCYMATCGPSGGFNTYLEAAVAALCEIARKA